AYVGGSTSWGDENLKGLGTFGDVSMDNVILAHEIGHNFGLVHPRDNTTPGGGCLSTGFNDGYTSLSIEEVGLYVSLMHLKPDSTHDYMTGGHCVDLGEEKWTGVTSWSNLASDFPSVSQSIALASPLSAQNQTDAVISGTLYANGTARLNPIFSTFNSTQA